MAYDEKSQAQNFLIKFFEVFGIAVNQVATFEHRVKKLDGSQGFVDLLWKGCILIEMKSRGKNLTAAHKQAHAYVETLEPHEIPRAIVISDFQNFHVYNLMNPGEVIRFKLGELRKYVKLFGIFFGLDSEAVHEQNPVNRKAAERMAGLHDALDAIGYRGHALEVYLVRLLFCLFSEDSEIFEQGQFARFITDHTSADGSNLASQLASLFEVLNTPPDKRLSILDPALAAFPYVNGALFEERLPLAAFTREMRESLIECTQLDWSQISPAIFGAMFQGVMNPEERRALGAHYTSEENILKLLQPLFLDELHEELERIQTLRGPARKRQLHAFHERLASLTFLDPACGCGNFLIITYRELRHIELEVLRSLQEDDPALVLDIALLLRITVDQFCGIELEAFPAEISRVSLWLMDHLCNLEVSKEFGMHYARIPIVDSPHIVCANALTTDWANLYRSDPPRPFSYILGNPPFYGARMMSPEQKQDLLEVFAGTARAGNLDFVTAWFKKAADLIQGTSTRVAFVATNSICQGEQVAILWQPLMEQLNIEITFAYRTFKWSNEARGVAAVHCVIVGFFSNPYKELKNPRAKNKTIYDKEGAPIPAHNINGYLVDAPDVFIANRKKPLCDVPDMGIGNKPIDGGNYLFSKEEMEEFITAEPSSAKWFKPWIGSREFINRYFRYCLWLGECPPHELRKMPQAMKRVEAVRQFRLESKSPGTRKIAATPTRFHVENMPQGNYIVVPKVSSERREYVPLGFLNPQALCSDLVFMIPDATLYHFGVLESRMHMAWMRTVCGRLEMRYRYSKDIVYNNFIWPQVSDKQEAAVSQAAQAILDARELYPDSSLADLYDPLTMPPELSKAHMRLDTIVDKLYGRTFTTDSDRVAHLFTLYAQKTTS